MSLNIIDLIKGQLGSGEISQASTNLGESESSISKAISVLLPTIVGGLANNHDKPGVLDSILGASAGNSAGNLTEGSNNSMITTILTALFGDKLSAITNSVSSYSGVSENSASSLLNMVTGATVGSLGTYASENNLGTSGLSSLLSEQKGIVSTLLPAGISLASLGLGHWGTSETTAVPPVTENIKVTSFDEPKVDVTRAGETHMNVEPENNNGGGSIWKWLLPLLLALIAAWFIWSRYNKSKDANTTASNTDSTMMKSDTMNTAPMMVDSTAMNASTKTDTDIDLNGKMIKGYAGGMEASMISFLKSGGYQNAADDAALKGTWYNFDKVNFKIGSATDLEAGSQGQLENLVAILKAYPEAKIKVGGYTDKTGDEAKNLTLSQERADFIKNALTKSGVGSQVLEAKGYGSSQATVAATATNDERAIDRKMAVRFAK
ncbi:OmpA family protein [Halpernia frigidisoli]|uniref:OmpA family protein n=1 Tax=Halpernia frigidisoli TaxID=1125876 RepID=A0A1I3IXZ8_9FLAO|nr:OmpA family protein [Halpernia frigidisoli]SFI52847.1 OmpA family protein [Halpernia frigidisoli]